MKFTRFNKIWNFAIKPSFALSVFALLFAAVIIGSTLTSPTVISAQKNERKEKLTTEQNHSNLGLARHQPVFKSAHQIGGSGITQIGAPGFRLWAVLMCAARLAEL